jgi:hypothetical protein
MKRCVEMCATACLAALIAAPCRAGEVSDYLTKDGKLKAAVTLRFGAHGLMAAGGPKLKAEVWVIEPTGEWTRQIAPAKGKLSAKQLAALAQHLATQDFNSLPRQQGYQSAALDEVFQYVLIGFGQKQTTFNFKIGESPTDYLPKAGDPSAAAWSRFVALELVLGQMLQESEFKEKKEK